MEFSSNPILREMEVTELIHKAFQSLEERMPMYDYLRTYYYYGNVEGYDVPTAYNMIKEKVDTISAFLYAGYTTAFDVDIEHKTDDSAKNYMNILMADRAAIALQDRWRESKLDITTAETVKNSLIYASYFIKLLWKDGRLRPYKVHPSNIGILNEFETSIDRQEVIIHRYTQSIHQLARDLVQNNHPKRERIAERVRVINQTGTASAYPRNLQRLIVTATEENYEGSLNRLPIINAMDRPRTTEPTVEMYEVWAWDDKADDYRVFTVASGDVIVYDRTAGKTLNTDGTVECTGVYIEKQHPFVKFCASPMEDYYWGWPEIFNILSIQNWHADRLEDIKRLHKKALDPPKAIYGGMSLPDERKAARELNEPRGLFTFRNAVQKIEEFKPDLPQSIYEELFDIRNLVDDQWGLQDIMKGKGVTGVRSRGQAEILTAYGSARLKGKAMLIEDSCTEVGHKALLLMHKYDGRHYTTEDGKPFTISQIKDEFQARVDSHSSSPIFVGELEDKAFALKDRDVIDSETLVDMLHVPFKDLLRHRARRREKEIMQQIADAQREGAREAQEKALEEEEKNKADREDKRLRMLGGS